MGRRGRGRWVTWGCSTPQPQSWCPDGPHAPQTFRGTREPRASPRGSPGEGEAATPRIPGGRDSCVPAGTLEGLVCWSLHAKGTWGARRRAGGLPTGLAWGSPGHRARSPQAGCSLRGAREWSLPDRAETVGTGQGTLHGLSPERAGARAQHAVWLHPKLAGSRRARGPGGSRGPHGLAAVPGYAPRLPGYPAEKARRTRGPGPAGSSEAAATVTATVTPEDRRAASWWGRSGSGPLPGATAWRGRRLVAALIASDRPRSTRLRCTLVPHFNKQQLERISRGRRSPPPSPPSPRLPSGLSGTKDL